eukprot:scaffold57228_cov15-Prasinocladus_malaysianus.AAC.1
MKILRYANQNCGGILPLGSSDGIPVSALHAHTHSIVPRLQLCGKFWGPEATQSALSRSKEVCGTPCKDHLGTVVSYITYYAARVIAACALSSIASQFSLRLKWKNDGSLRLLH